jgi:hypothetical protein
MVPACGGLGHLAKKESAPYETHSLDHKPTHHATTTATAIPIPIRITVIRRVVCCSISSTKCQGIALKTSQLTLNGRSLNRQHRPYDIRTFHLFTSVSQATSRLSSPPPSRTSLGECFQSSQKRRFEYKLQNFCFLKRNKNSLETKTQKQNNQENQRQPTTQKNKLLDKIQRVMILFHKTKKNFFGWGIDSKLAQPRVKNKLKQNYRNEVEIFFLNATQNK